jgi:hypothetical protein
MSPSRHRQAEVGVDLKKLLVLLPMWIAFVLGSTLGADAQNGDRPGLGPDGDRNERSLAGDDDDDEYEFKLMNDGSWMTTPGPRNRLLIARFGLMIYLPAGSERKQLYNYLLSFF